MTFVGLVSSKDMTTGNITDKLGEPMGSVKELMIDPQTGRVEMLVIGFGGLLGMGDTTRVIPWQAIQLLPHSQNYQINVDKQLVDEAPAMTAEDARDRTKVRELYRHFGIQPYWGSTADVDTSDPSYQNPDATLNHPAYSDATTNQHQQYEGSFQVSQPYFRSNEDNKLGEELDYDKIKGLKPSGGGAGS